MPKPRPTPPFTSTLAPSTGYPAVTYSPASALMKGEKRPCLVTRFTTPAMASDPYCADAPSRSTSMWSMAEAGMAFMSTPLDPAAVP